MRILLVTSEFGEQGGGLSFACEQFAHILTALHHEYVVVSSTEKRIITAKGGYNPSLHIRISDEYRLKGDIALYSDSRADLIVSFGGGFNGHYAQLLAKKLKKPLYLLLRGTDINLAKWDSQETFYLREAANEALRIVCLTEEMIENISLLTPECREKACVIPNILQNKPAEVRFPNWPKEIVMGCAASHINEKKGIANLLCILKELMGMTDVRISLDVVGDVDTDLMQQYEQLTDDMDLSGNVRFVGYQTRDKFLEMSKSWDFYIQGSVCEGFCNAVAESICAGRGVILSPTGYICEYASSVAPWMRFSTWNPASAAAEILCLISRPHLAEAYDDAYSQLYKKTEECVVMKEWEKVLAMQPLQQKATRTPSHILSLALHEVRGEMHDHITTPALVFSSFAERLYDNGYGLCSMRSYLEKSEAERQRWIVCTFDDGYASLQDIVAPVLSKYGFSATVFINTAYIGQNNEWNWKDPVVRWHLNKEGIIKLSKAGWEIGSHGHTHRNILRLTEAELETELSESKRILEAIAGPICAYAYPYGDSSPYTRKICSRYYSYAFALHEGGTELCVDSNCIRRYSIDEISKILGI